MNTVIAVTYSNQYNISVKSQKNLNGGKNLLIYFGEMYLEEAINQEEFEKKISYWITSYKGFNPKRINFEKFEDLIKQ